MKIQVEESALDAIAAMAQKLQEERDELLDAVKGSHCAFRSIVNGIPDASGYARKCADALDELITKCTAEPDIMEKKR